MDKLLIYSLKSAISLAVLYFFYWLFLRKSTHFRLNRFVIIFSVIISIVLPPLANLFRLPVPENLTLNISFPVSGDAVFQSPQMGDVNLQENLSLIEIIGLIYITGAGIILARLAYQAIYLHAVERLSKTSYIRGFKIISLDTDMIPFSYFKRIFIPAGRFNENSVESVITHEETHLSQGHYLDLFVIQFVTLLQWFNPFSWLFEKSLKEIHEFLADEAVLQTGKDMGNYQAVLVNEAMGGPVFILTNQFNKSIIKKRILMMKQVKSPKITQLKALLLLPLIACMLLAFANPALISQTVEEAELTVKNDLVITGNVSDRFSGSPIAGANLIIKGTTIGTITDIHGNYKIIVNNPHDVLIVSVTGYRTQEIPLGKNTKIDALMEPDIIAIDFDKQNSLDVFEEPAVNKSTESGSGGGFVFEEKMPAYPGGTIALQKFIRDNLRYPDGPKQSGLEGTVLVTYTIDVNGEVSKPRVIRGIQQDLDAEALRLTNLIKGWKPATHGGRPVPTTVTMPVEFRLK